MRATIILFAAAAACGSVHDRSACASSADCPAGSYCARTGDGDVCWPDATAPIVSGVSVACDHDPCLRSDVLHVTATITDDAELLGADVSLLGSTAIPLARAGGTTWTANLPLARFPFEAFEAEVVATVTARDGARNERSAAAGPAVVTRLAWERGLDSGVFSLTTPALMADGTIVAAGTNGKVYFVPWDGVGIASLAVGGGQITAAPLALGTSVWVGSEDNKVYEVKKNGVGVWSATERADTGGPVKGSLATTVSGYVIAASDSGVVYAVPPAGLAKNSGIGSPFALGPVVDEDDSVFAVAGGTVRRLTITLGIPGDAWSPNVTLGSTVGVGLAFADGLLAPASNGTDGLLKRVAVAGGDPEHLATTAIPSGGVVVLGDGSILVPEVSKTLSRFTSAGAAAMVWQRHDLGGAARTPLVLDSESSPFVVSTGGGAVHALRSDGNIAWTAQFGTAALQPSNIYTPPGQPPDEVTSIAYFAGADGWLHAVIVDGKLDGNAPWPKAFHDPRNTNRAGAQP